MPTRDGPSKIWEARWGTDTDAPAGALSGNVRYFPLPVYQSWADVVFLHWRIPVAVALPYMPPGVEPDVYAGSTWVGLIGFRVPGTRLGRLGLPYAGTFTEVNVRLYSRDAAGRHGVVFLSLDADRLAFVLAARAAGVPYVWSRCRPTTMPGTIPRGYGYEVERFRRQGTSSFGAYPAMDHPAVDGLSLWLTARFGLHARVGRRVLYLPIAHRPWPLYPAGPATLEDALVCAAGITVHGPPDSVLYSPGVRTQFGWPRQVLG
ncbi:YqjF family protein [Arthrobacter sp. NPDC057013]|uniref:YqjF family protein n=1 Tax=Arthrobacter sp. NPDC057013 TaxID=3345999 RepID=UPI00363C44B1